MSKGKLNARDAEIERLYQIAISEPLDQKVEKSIAAFKLYEPAALTWDMFEPWFHGCTSHGKDSGVARRLQEMSGVAAKWYNSHTTIDPPELIRFGRETHPDTIVSYPKIPMLQMLAEKKGTGPPTRISRWCCEMYKENGCYGQIKVFGVRATESGNRKANWRLWTPLRDDRSWVLNPILYWTDADIWEFTHRENIPYCKLYDEKDANGEKIFTRLGCIGCPMGGRKGRMAEFERWPGYEKAWKNAFKKFWNNWHGVPIIRERWVSMEGKWPFRPIAGERTETQYVEKAKRDEKGFWTYRRWYDLKEYTCWEDLWDWWMENEEQPAGCAMGQF